MEAQRVKVLQLNQDDAVALTDTGAFVRIKKKPQMAIGQGIYITSSDLMKTSFDFSWIKQAMKVAAISAVLVLLVLSNSLSPMTYAIISVDINPSFQLSVDEDYQVIKIESKNADGEALLEAYDFNRGDIASDVISDLIALATEMSYIDEETSEILIGAALSKDAVKAHPEALENQTEKELADHVIQEVLDHVDYTKVGSYEIEVKSVPVNAGKVKSAEEESLTIGEYERTHHGEEVKSYAKIQNGKAVKEPNPNANPNSNMNSNSKDKDNPNTEQPSTEHNNNSNNNGNNNNGNNNNGNHNGNKPNVQDDPSTTETSSTTETPSTIENSDPSKWNEDTKGDGNHKDDKMDGSKDNGEDNSKGNSKGNGHKK